MALELKKKKYLVMCVMLILLNHHINEVKGAENLDPEKGSNTETPENGSKAPMSQVSNHINGTKGAENLDPKKGTNTKALENGSKAPTSQVSNHHINGVKGAENLDPKKGSNTEFCEKESKASTSQVSNHHINGTKGADNLDPKKGSNTETPENGSKAPTSQVSNHHINETKGAENLDPKKGSNTKAPENGSNDNLDPKEGSNTKAPEKGSKSSTSQVSNSRPRTQVLSRKSRVLKSESEGAEAPTLGSGSIDEAPSSQVPNYSTQTFKTGIMNKGNKPLINVMPNKITDNGTTTGQPQVPCYFIFGDSLVDVGNNNHLSTLARADYDPYGIDFKPLGATGRFSNGKTTVDFMAELLGFDHYMPPSERTNGTDILQGLNFASAAAGIREETAQHLGDRNTMKEQVDNFKNKVGEMAGLLGGPKNTTDYLGKCLFQVGFGNNDYLNNYFMPNIYPTSKLLTPEQYADDLIKQYTTHLMAIYDLGARKFALTGISQVGCTPSALAQASPDGTCVKSFNDANEIFNNRLKTLTDTLNKDHPDAKFTYINAFGLFQELKDNASSFGFKVTTDGCCGVGKYHGQITCLPGQTPCPNRNEYIFWDAYHPTEVTNMIGAKRSYIKQSPTDACPYDIHTLITLK